MSVAISVESFVIGGSGAAAQPPVLCDYAKTCWRRRNSLLLSVLLLFSLLLVLLELVAEQYKVTFEHFGDCVLHAFNGNRVREGTPEFVCCGEKILGQIVGRTPPDSGVCLPKTVFNRPIPNTEPEYRRLCAES